MSRDITVLVQRKADAESALHELLMGRMARVYVDQSGERVEFTMTNVGALRSYISALDAEIRAASTASGRPSVRPMYFY